MKKILMVMAIAVFTVFGCGKSNESADQPQATTLHVKLSTVGELPQDTKIGFIQLFTQLPASVQIPDNFTFASFNSSENPLQSLGSARGNEAGWVYSATGWDAPRQLEVYISASSHGFDIGEFAEFVIKVGPDFNTQLPAQLPIYGFSVLDTNQNDLSSSVTISVVI